MKARVVVLRGAEADLSELWRYICRRFGAQAWSESLTSIRQTITQIAHKPEAGHISDELAALNLAQFRQRMAGLNRIVDELRGTTAYVHLVCDARRDLTTVLMRRLLSTT